MIVSACMNTNPMMIYFGQELGESGMDSEGFSGRDGRTTISITGALTASAAGTTTDALTIIC